MGTGAMDRMVGLDDVLRADVTYERPRRGGRDLFDLLGDLAGHRILDIGCGLGQYRRAIEERGAAWIGLDLTGPACTVIADGGHLPFRDGAFDGILCAAVFEHMPEPDRMMVELRRVLCPGGTLFGYAAFLEPFHGMSYFHTSHMGLEYLLSKNGFRPVRVYPSLLAPAYQLECMLFPRHVPLVQPALRRLLQWGCSLLLDVSAIAHHLTFRLRRRPEARDPRYRQRYRRFLSLRYAIGFNFVAERDEAAGTAPAGYSALIRDH